MKPGTQVRVTNGMNIHPRPVLVNRRMKLSFLLCALVVQAVVVATSYSLGKQQNLQLCPPP